MADERRRAERFDSNLFVDLRSSELNDRIGRGIVIDVSLSGLAIETEADLPLNYEVACSIEIPIRIRTKVVRRIDEGHIKRYGLQIVKMNLWDKFLFRKFMKGIRATLKV